MWISIPFGPKRYGKMYFFKKGNPDGETHFKKKPNFEPPYGTGWLIVHHFWLAFSINLCPRLIVKTQNKAINHYPSTINTRSSHNQKQTKQHYSLTGRLLHTSRVWVKSKLQIIKLLSCCPYTDIPSGLVFPFWDSSRHCIDHQLS